MASTVTAAPPSIHPLDPLSAAEIERAWEIVRAERPLGPRVRVIFVMLHEPDRKVVLGHRPGDRVDRAAFVVLIDSAAGKTYEAVAIARDHPLVRVGGHSIEIRPIRELPPR